MIPLSQPDITQLEIEAVTEVLRSSRLSLGPYLNEFEERVQAFLTVPHAVAVSSGTAGLHLCLLALGVGSGDEVIVPSFAFIAAANVIRHVGAVPVFVDIDPGTLNMDPARVEAAVTPKTKALMVVHTFGLPADLDTLTAIARRHGLLLIEDACEALGATYRDQPVGTFGDAAVFAFYPNKQITTGEGGMVVTQDAALARDIRALRNQGRYESDDWLQHSLLGYNYRLSELHCALGVAQMQRLPEILSRRQEVADLYRAALDGLPLVLPPTPPMHARMSWFVYVVRLDEAATGDRDEVLVQMQARGVQCGRYFAPIHRQPAYAGWPLRSELPVTERISKQTLALPFFNALTPGQVSYIAEVLASAMNETGSPSQASRE